ncbi:MAG: HPr family phosphocarrier protein [Ruminococcus sp.]|nr:HPr family phosphocarrier protein [Ruminococcus sp.]
MKSFVYTITDEVGIHARPAGLLVKKANEYDSEIIIEKNGKICDATRLIGLMSLAVKQGDTVTVKIEGADEEAAALEMEQFFKENL